MNMLTKRELGVLVGILLLCAVLLYPALIHARREARDGIRVNEVAAFKVVLEQYYNEHDAYPLDFDASPHEYVVIKEAGEGVESWYLKAQLENGRDTEEGYDAEAGRNYYFRIVNQDGISSYEVCGGQPGCPLADRQ